MSRFRPATRVLFALLCLLWFVYALTFIPARSHRSFETTLILPQEQTAVAEIRISIPQQSGEIKTGIMKKQCSRFFLQTEYGSYPVRQDLIERLFSVLSEKRPCTIMSKKVQDYAQYGLNEAASKITLTGTDRTIISELFFGKTDTMGLQRYVRTGSSITVFAVDNTIAPFLSLAHTFWLDLQPYKALFDSSDLQSLEINSRQIVKNGKNAEDFAALQSCIQIFTCIDTAPQIEAEPAKTIGLFFGSGKKIELFYQPLKSGDYIISDTQSRYAYTASNYSFSRLLKLTAALR